MAGCGVFLGLSAMTVTLLRTDGIMIPGVALARLALLAGAVIWAAALAWQIGARWVDGMRRAAMCGLVAMAAGVGASAWVILFWVW